MGAQTQSAPGQIGGDRAAPHATHVDAIYPGQRRKIGPLENAPALLELVGQSGHQIEHGLETPDLVNAHGLHLAS